MAITQTDPPQIQADDTPNFTRTETYSTAAAGQNHVPNIVHTVTIHKRTPTGTDGSITFTNGKVTASVKPT